MRPVSSAASNEEASIVPTSTETKSRLQTFRALRYRDFRFLWISLIVSSVGTWMQIIAQSLLVLQITHNSPLALGIVALAQSSSFFLFALVGGGVADLVDKRRFLLITQSLSMLLAFILGILTITGVVQVWMVVILAFCSGSVLSFDQPTRSSLIPVLVPKQLALFRFRAGNGVGRVVRRYTWRFPAQRCAAARLIFPLDGRAGCFRAEPCAMAFAAGPAVLRHVSKWRRSDGHHAGADAGATPYARASDEPEHAAGHGRKAAGRFSGQRTDSFNWWPFDGDYLRDHRGQLCVVSPGCQAGDTRSLKPNVFRNSKKY